MKIKNLNKSILLIIIVIFLTASSCAKKMQTQTITSLGESDRAKINNVAILVETDQQLDVNLSTMGDRIWVAMLQDSGSCGDIGCIFLPFIVAATAIIEESVRSGMDHAKENEFRNDLSELDINKSLSVNIDKLLESSNAGFSADVIDTNNPNLLVQRGYDSVLHLILNKIQLNKCPRHVVGGYIHPGEAVKGLGPLSSDTSFDEAISKWNAIYPEYFKNLDKDTAHKFLSAPDTILKSKKEIEENEKLERKVNTIKPAIEKYGSSHQLRIWMHYSAKIISLLDNKVLWDREELYYDPECELVKDMKEDPNLAVDMISRSLINMASSTINNILYYSPD